MSFISAPNAAHFIFPSAKSSQFPLSNLTNSFNFFPKTSIKASSSSHDLISSDLPPSYIPIIPDSYTASSGIEVDAVTEVELKENGFRSTRRTKLVCTIGPASCGFDQLEALAVGGMNVARINMCHGTREWHKRVIERVRKLNEEKGFAVAIMMDTEGSEIHMGDLGGESAVKAEVTLLTTFHFLFI